MVFGLFKKSGGGEQVSTYADVVVVSLSKSAYYADARDNLLKTVQQAVDDSPTGRVVIEMSNVKQFTSGPLGALVVCARKADEKGGQLVRGLGERVCRQGSVHCDGNKEVTQLSDRQGGAGGTVYRGGV